MTRPYCAHAGDGRTACVICGEPYPASRDLRTRGARVAFALERAWDRGQWPIYAALYVAVEIWLWGAAWGLVIAAATFALLAFEARR